MVWIVKNGLSYKVYYICCFITENRIGNMKQFFPTFFFLLLPLAMFNFGFRLKFSVVDQSFEISYLQLCTVNFGGKIKIFSFRIILEFIEKDMCTIKG